MAFPLALIVITEITFRNQTANKYNILRHGKVEKWSQFSSLRKNIFENPWKIGWSAE